MWWGHWCRCRRWWAGLAPELAVGLPQTIACVGGASAYLAARLSQSPGRAGLSAGCTTVSNRLEGEFENGSHQCLHPKWFCVSLQDEYKWVPFTCCPCAFPTGIFVLVLRSRPVLGVGLLRVEFSIPCNPRFSWMYALLVFKASVWGGSCPLCRTQGWECLMELESLTLQGKDLNLHDPSRLWVLLWLGCVFSLVRRSLHPSYLS